ASAAHAAPCRLGDAPLERSGLSTRLPVGGRAALLGGIPAGSGRADCNHRRAPAAAPLEGDGADGPTCARAARRAIVGRVRRGRGAMRNVSLSLRFSAAALGAVAILCGCGSSETPATA